MEIPQDLLGREFKRGQTIVYATTQSSSVTMNYGVITEIIAKPHKYRPDETNISIKVAALRGSSWQRSYSYISVATISVYARAVVVDALPNEEDLNESSTKLARQFANIVEAVNEDPTWEVTNKSIEKFLA